MNRGQKSTPDPLIHHHSEVPTSTGDGSKAGAFE